MIFQLREEKRREEKRRGKSGQGSLTAVVLGGVLLSTLVASATSWYITMRNNIGNTEDKLEAQTIAQSEWERLSHMSLDELEANRNTFKTPYSAGTGSQYSISVNLGEKGTFNNGTCGGVSGGYANCFKDTTITVYRDGNRMFTTRTLPLMAGDYTRKEIDEKINSINNALIAQKNDYISRDNNLRTDYTNKYNTLANRLNGKEFVKNKTTNYTLSMGYNASDKKMHFYVDGTELFAQGKNEEPEKFSDKGGYYIFPNGLIMQWGLGDASCDPDVFPYGKNYFPIPFPHKCLNITGNQTGYSFDFSVRLWALDRFSFKADSSSGLENQPNSFYWIAIGY